MTVAKAIAGNRTTYSGRPSKSNPTPSSATSTSTDSTPVNFSRELLRDIPTVSPCTHLANAYRIQHYYQGQIWYVIGVGWIVWTGQFWKPDPTSDHSIATGFVNGLSQYIAAESAQLAEQASNEQNRDLRKLLLAQAAELIKWATASENAHNIASGLQLSKYALLHDYDALNADPWLFNCQNGTLDLRTGKLQPHHSADLITFVAPVTFDPAATCPTWQRFLLEVFANDVDMVAFIQRAIGWSLTGVVKERALFFLYGENGKNGKSTLVETIMKLVGICGESSYGYSRKVTADTFMKSRNHDDNQRKAATLAGPRFVCTSEVAEEHRLNEQLIKDITGGDTIEARRLYQEAFTFKPQFKPWMYGNHKPTITGTDDAIWSRVRMVPFEVSFVGREDLELPAKLAAELSGILNWAIRGCLDWQRSGLQPPAKVQAATQAYRDEMDVFGPFITECCVIHKNAEVWSAELWAAYKNWCAVAGVKEQTQHKLGRYLSGKGFCSDESSGRTKRLGIGLRIV
jgi:putative DNA primase/helicase